MHLPRWCAAMLVALALLAPATAAAQRGLSDDEVLAGFGVADMTPPIGVPLAGYSNRRAGISEWFSSNPYAALFNPSTAVHDPIEARAMAIERGGRRLVFLRLDLVAVSADLVGAVRTRIADLAISEDQFVVSATHTHSGPGAWMDSLVWALIGTDRYQPDVFQRLVDGAERAVRAAVADLAPAMLFAGSFTIDGLQRNRRDRGAPTDRTANLVLARSRDNVWRGGLVNFAVHPTALPAANLAFTADIAGGIERDVATMLRGRNGTLGDPGTTGRYGYLPVTLLFLNGALGDVSPTDRGYEGIARIGEAFAYEAGVAVNTLRPIGSAWTVKTVSVDLGAPRLALQNCANPRWLRWIVGHDVGVRLGEVVSHVAMLRLLRIGDVGIMTWPGEPTSSLGLELRAAALAAGIKQPIVAGIAGDYMAYFTSPEEFARPTYESCMSWFGPKGGERIVEAYRQLMTAP